MSTGPMYRWERDDEAFDRIYMPDGGYWLYRTESSPGPETWVERLNSAYLAGHAAGKGEVEAKNELRPLCGVTADGVTVRLGDPIWGHFMDKPSFAYQGNERYIKEFCWSDPNHPDRQAALSAHKKGAGDAH